LPGGQLRQEAKPESANHPEGQSVHDLGRVSPLDNENNMYEPASHVKHSDASSNAHFPAAQSVQNADPAFADFPTIHILHAIMGGNVASAPFITFSCTNALPTGQSVHL
jgi:hypothetical protein